MKQRIYNSKDQSVLVEITKELGEGGCGKVYLTTDNKAVKVFDLSDKKTCNKKNRLFIEEVNAVGKLNFN